MFSPDNWESNETETPEVLYGFSNFRFLEFLMTRIHEFTELLVVT